MSSQKKQFEKFYQKHLDAVFRYVYFRVNDRATAEDLVSDIFVKALKNFDLYDPKISASAWIMTIAKNTLANFWRDRKLAVSLDAENDETDDLPGDVLLAKQAHAKVKEREMTQEVTDLLAQLSPLEAELVTLHYLSGYSYKEIAVMQGSSEGAVKVAAHRVIKKMKGLV